VQPASESSFKAKFREVLPIKRGENFFPGERPGEAGKKIWVCYDPNNKKKMIIDHYDKNHEWAMKRLEFEKVDQRDERIRKTGESAVALILEVEDLMLTNNIEKDEIGNTSLRLRLQITRSNGEAYEGSTQGMFSHSNLHKYRFGKKVNLMINPQDKSQIALVGAVEE